MKVLLSLRGGWMAGAVIGGSNAALENEAVRMESGLAKWSTGSLASSSSPMR